ncbi:MAG TPA: hypothetical protein VHR66_27640 [Gemmataceae bacterium]|jgi:hypothetical protein|nr:hypothetical protein [Gemmataceae bacterium]
MATSHGHGGEFVPTGPTHDLAYEPDTFAVKTILAVPVAVIITGVLAFVITSLIFSNIFAPSAYDVPPTVPAAAAENAAPLNDRLARMSSSDANAPIQQPRLEAMNRKQEYPGGMWGSVRGEWITTQATKDGNSPHYHSDDLRTDRFPATATFAKDPATGLIRVPVDKAIAMAADPTNADWTKALPSSAGAIRLDADPRFGWDRPKESNGGNARLPAETKPAEPKKGVEEPKKDEPKKDEPKKDEPKKE